MSWLAEAPYIQAQNSFVFQIERDTSISIILKENVEVSSSKTSHINTSNMAFKTDQIKIRVECCSVSKYISL